MKKQKKKKKKIRQITMNTLTKLNRACLLLQPVLSPTPNSSASTTPETAKPNLCLLPPPQSPQHEEDKYEDIYGELLPLNE